MTTPSLTLFFRFGSLFLVMALFLLTGCDSPSSRIQEIKRNLDIFKRSPNQQTKEALEKSFAKMEVQIQELEAKGDTVQFDLFRRQAFTLRYDFHSTLLAIAKWNAEEADRRAAAQAAVIMPSPEVSPSAPASAEPHKE
ncbi:MAG: hypothetical protein NTZ94_07775 [Verrucomicrobia bacterium]|nr:hypothetical protein [Verrucomicrobiota bacterium]